MYTTSFQIGYTLEERIEYNLLNSLILKATLNYKVAFKYNVLKNL